MKTTRTAKVVCATREEAANIQRALDNVEVRAFLGLVGVMMQSGEPDRTRVLTYVNDTADEEAGGRLSITSKAGRHAVEASRALEHTPAVPS